MKRAYSTLITISVVLFLAVLFYFLATFFNYKLSDVDSSSLTIMFVYFCLVAFSLGVLLALLTRLVQTHEIFINMALLNLALGVVVVWEFFDKDLFKVIVVPLVVFTALYLFSLFIFFKSRLEALRQTQGKEAVSKEFTTFHEKRKHPRYKEALLLEMEYPSGRKQGCLTFDVGFGGVCLIVHEELKRGAEVKIVLRLPLDTRPIYAQGHVLWSSFVEMLNGKPYYHVGIAYSKIDSADRMRLLSRYIYDVYRGKPLGG